MIVQTQTILASIYAVLNIGMLTFIGFLLAKLKVLTPDGRRVANGLIYYVFAPLYCLLFIMQAIDREKLDELVLVLLSFLPCLLIGFIIFVVLTWILSFDVRIRLSFTFVNVYMNFIVVAQLLASTLCEKGGLYVDTPSCKNKLVSAYTAIPLIFLNFLYWVTVLPCLLYERRIAKEIRQIYAIVLNYYNSVEDFLKDSSLENAVCNMAQKDQNADKSKENSSSKLNPDGKIPLSLTSDHFIEEYYSKVVTASNYICLKSAFDKFKEKIFDQPSNASDKKLIEDDVLIPGDLMVIPPTQNVFTLEFVRDQIILSPPALWSILGIILGFIFPFKEWLFNPENKPIPIFLGSLQNVASMVIPTAMFLLGSYLAEGIKVSKDMLIGWRHIVFSCAVRNIIMPAIGLFWILVLIRAMNEKVYMENPVLMFINFTHWIAPTGVVLIVVYAYADYFTREFCVISVAVSVLSLPAIAVALMIYFTLYDSSIQ